MFSGVNSFLGFNSGCISDSESLAITQTEENGCFILHQVLGSAVRAGRPVCLVSFVHKLHHYHSVAAKAGVSLTAAQTDGRLAFIDGLDELANTFFPEDNKTSSATETENLLTSLTKKIFDSVCGLCGQRDMSGKSPVLVIDDPSVLLSVGFPVDRVLMFLQTVQMGMLCGDGGGGTLVEGSYEGRRGGSLVVLTSMSEDDLESVRVCSFLAALSTVSVTVTGLETGYCKDVHGQATVTTRDGMMAPRIHTTRTLQFKLSENGAHFFAAGTSSAVL